MFYKNNTLNMIIFVFVFFILVPGCSTSHYGVADEEWQKMSEAERVVAIEGYNERQRIREESRLEEAKAKRVVAEQRARERKEHIQSIYNGNGGQFGDLLRVSMKGGKIRIGGKHRSYRPVSFKIADKECKSIKLVSEKKHSSHGGQITACYRDGLLLLDVSGSGSRGATALTYDSGWAKGQTYQHVESDGKNELENVEVYVLVVAPRGQGNVIEHRVW